MEQTVYLPFYRTVPDIYDDEITLASIINYDPYFLHCLDSQLRNTVPVDYRLVSEFSFDEQKMYWTLRFISDQATRDKVESMVDEIIRDRINYFPVWTPQCSRHGHWEANVIVPYIEQEYPDFIFYKDMVLGMLPSLGPDYNDQIKKLEAKIYDWIDHAWSHGYIACDKDFADEWDLKETSIKGIYASRDGLSSEFLFQRYIFPDSNIIVPTAWTESIYVKYHHLSKIGQKHKASLSFLDDMAILPPDASIDLIQEISDYIPVRGEEPKLANVIPCTQETVDQVIAYVRKLYKDLTAYSRLDDPERPIYVSFITNETLATPLDLTNVIGAQLNQEAKTPMTAQESMETVAPEGPMTPQQEINLPGQAM